MLNLLLHHLPPPPPSSTILLGDNEPDLPSLEPPSPPPHKKLRLTHAATGGVDPAVLAMISSIVSKTDPQGGKKAAAYTGKAAKTEHTKPAASSAAPAVAAAAVRPRCHYWDSCFRSNPAHLAEFTHPPKGKPGQAARQASASSSSGSLRLPMCQFGAGCYRKNPDHLAEFRHPDRRDAAPLSGDSDVGRGEADDSDGEWGVQ
jgi:hypothetical protein